MSSTFKWPRRSAIAGLFCLAGIGTVVVGCNDDGSAAVDKADIVYRNGYVYTVDGDNSVKQAVAIRNGVFVYVGDNAGVSDYVGTRTEVVDLNGRMMMPGLVDGHMHPTAGGRALLLCNLNYASLTRAQLQAAIQVCLDNSTAKEPDGWLEVVNWSRQGTSAVDADPTKATLDALKTKRPIVVRSSDFHSILTNTRGLALAGVTSATQDPAGGSFGRDASGQLTGIAEDAASFIVNSVVPGDDDADRVAQLRAALAAINAQGVTTFMDAAAGEAQAVALTTIQKAGGLTARPFLAVQIGVEEATASTVAAVREVKALRDRLDQGDWQAQSPSVSIRHIKLFGDGVVNAPADTGALLSPYFKNAGTAEAPNWVPGDNAGRVYFPPAVFKPLMAEIARADFDVHVHATGERTVRETLDAIEHARQQVPSSSFRPGITHNETVALADYPRYKALNVLASFSFQWAQQAPYSTGETEAHLGPDRFARMEPSGSLHKAGARVAYGSDWPIDPLDEMLALKIGVTRSGDPTNPNSFGPAFAGKINNEPGLSRADALRAITMNSAWQLRMEDKIGSIEVGKFADLIVLDRNFMQVPEAELARNQVLLTVVGGKVVMAKAPFGSVGAAAASQGLAGVLALRPQGNQQSLSNRLPRTTAQGAIHGDGHNH